MRPVTRRVTSRCCALLYVSPVLPIVRDTRRPTISLFRVLFRRYYFNITYLVKSGVQWSLESAERSGDLTECGVSGLSVDCDGRDEVRGAVHVGVTELWMCPTRTQVAGAGEPSLRRGRTACTTVVRYSTIRLRSYHLRSTRAHRALISRVTCSLP